MKNLDDGLILELNADGIIRDANTGEHYGNVPVSLRALYGAAPALLKAAKELLQRQDQFVHAMYFRSQIDDLREAVADAEGGAK